jgi:DNA-binding XRE family transcriptional regulator
MKTAENMPLEVRIVGFDAALRRKIQAAWHRVAFETWTISNCQNMPRNEVVRSLWVVELNQRSASHAECLRNFLSQTRSNSPIFMLSDWGPDRLEMSSWIENLLELFGARVFVGKEGFARLCTFLTQTGEKDPAEIIVDVRLSDDGLHVSFADNKRALIPLSQARRLAESQDILWDSIRIAGDRTYITVSTRSAESIPIPQDVLREFVTDDGAMRVATTLRERNLTAKTLGVTLRAARRKMKFSQEELASRAGTSRWTIHRIEKGIYLPKVSLLNTLSRALNQNIEDLLVP